MTAVDDGVLGAVVTGGPAARPEPVTLRGRFVTLAPLTAAHADDLHAATAGPQGEALWTYLPDGPFDDREGFDAMVARKAASSDPLFFAIIDNASGRAVGHAGLMRIEPVHRVIEVGNILFGTGLQHTTGATESMALLAGYVFDTLGYRRYEWKCNDRNMPSRRAAERLGFRFEGIFRQHMIVKGRNRDTAWFAMTDRDWPACRAAFARWLAPANFDAGGRQLHALATLRHPED